MLDPGSLINGETLRERDGRPTRRAASPADRRERLRYALRKIGWVVALPAALLWVWFWQMGRYERQRMQQPRGPTGQPPRAHQVKPGETLRSLAQQYYNNPRLWPEIYHANRERLAGQQGLGDAKVVLIPHRKAE